LNVDFRNPAWKYRPLFVDPIGVVADDAWAAAARNDVERATGHPTYPVDLVSHATMGGERITDSHDPPGRCPRPCGVLLTAVDEICDTDLFQRDARNFPTPDGAPHSGDYDREMASWRMREAKVKTVASPGGMRRSDGRSAEFA